MESMEWVYRFLNERGLAQQLALYIIIRNILAVAIARARKVLPECYTRQLFAFSVIPFMLGVVGAIRVTTMAAGGLAYYLASSPAPTTEDAYSGLLRVMGMSMDNLLLGLIGTIISLYLYVLALTSKNMVVQQAGPAHPPQGVGSADRDAGHKYE